MIICVTEVSAKKIIAKLSPKESAVIRLRFGLVEDNINDERYKITDEQVDDLSEGYGFSDE